MPLILVNIQFNKIVLVIGIYSNSVPETWAKFSNDNIQRSQSERKASKDMRDRIEQLLIHSANLMLHYWNSVNNAFTDKIKEQVEAKHKIQIHLSKVKKTCGFFK